MLFLANWVRVNAHSLIWARLPGAAGIFSEKMVWMESMTTAVGFASAITSKIFSSDVVESMSRLSAEMFSLFAREPICVADSSALT